MLTKLKQFFQRSGTMTYTRVLGPQGETFTIITDQPRPATEKKIAEVFRKVAVAPQERMMRYNRAIMKAVELSRMDTPLNREQRRKLQRMAKRG